MRLVQWFADGKELRRHPSELENRAARLAIRFALRADLPPGLFLTPAVASSEVINAYDHAMARQIKMAKAVGRAVTIRESCPMDEPDGRGDVPYPCGVFAEGVYVDCTMAGIAGDCALPKGEPRPDGNG